VDIRLVLSLGAWLFLLMPMSSVAHGDEHPGQSSTEESIEVEELVEVEELTEIETDDADRSPLLSYIGSKHPAVVHFPIAWMVLLCLVELVGLSRRHHSWHEAGKYLLVLTVAGFLPAVGSGLIQADAIVFTGQYVEILELHRNLNFVAAGVALVALAVRWRLNTRDNRHYHLMYVAVVVVATGITMYSGHLGGRLVHG
jgi:uncharacterized membrane protein